MSEDPVGKRQALFDPPSRETVRELNRLREAIGEALPLKKKHKAALAGNIKALSEALTTERGPSVGRDYLAGPEALGAYAYYFLPWNVLRLSRLLPGLDMDLGDGAHIADLGAGPLTFMLALWTSCPNMRERSLVFHCLDRNLRVMRLGRDIFRALTGENRPPWRIHLVHAPLIKGLSETGTPDLVFAGNLLNEIRWSREDHLDMQVEEFAGTLVSRLSDTGRVLVVEPGARLGGRLVSLFRAGALNLGLRAVSPGPHQETCPMLDGRYWCHFKFDTRGAPEWLTGIANKAGLPKKDLNLSFVCLDRGEAAPCKTSKTPVRVLSEMFSVADGSKGRYGCSERGLILLTGPDAKLGNFRPGDLVFVDFPDRPQQDPKSRAFMVSAP